MQKVDLIGGIGVGSIDCVVPVWSAEVSSHSARGAFLALEFVMVCYLVVLIRLQS